MNRTLARVLEVATVLAVAALVAARVREMYDKAAKERQKVRKGKQPGTTVEKIPQLENPTKARDAAGKAVGVNGKYVDQATKVLAKAVPEVVKAVEDGRCSWYSARSRSCASSTPTRGDAPPASLR